MKNQASLLLVLILVLSIPACLPEDDGIDTGDPVTKFLGTWNYSETCRKSAYSIEIIPDPGNSAQVLIKNFCNPGWEYDPAVGVVSSNYIHVYPQTIGEGWTVDGKGTYQSNGNITWEYTLIIPPNEFTCSATSTPLD
jgi:hypothetical protein